MKLESWALIAEVVSAIAVVLSLIFVGLQIQQNSKAQIQAGTQTVVSEYNDGVRALSIDPGLVCVYLRGLQDYSSLSGVDRVRFNAFFLSMFNVQQQIHRFRLDGAIDEDVWSGFDAQLKDVVRLPGVNQWFETRAHWYGRDFRAYIESARSEPPPQTNPLLLRADPACTPTPAATPSAPGQ
jgi:hypothetical protein